jgi:hypothetical protein
MKTSIVIICALFLAILISGCQTNQPGANNVGQKTESMLPSDTPFLTNTPESTFTPVSSDTPAPTNTEIPPTATFTPTFTPIPSPTSTLKLDLRMVFRNGCEVPVRVEVSGPISFSITIQTRELKNVYAPVGTYTFWNDKTKEHNEYQLNTSVFPYCICMKICHADP